MNKQCQQPQAHPDRCGCVREIAEHNAQAYAEAITALAAKDARIAELEEHCKRLGAGDAERYWEGRWRDADAELSRLRDATTTSEDGGEVPEVVGWRVYNPRTKKTRFYGASKGYLMEGFQNVGYQTEAVTTVAQHSRIVAAKDAEIAEWKLRCQYNADTAHDVAAERDELRAALLKVSQDGDTLRAELQAQPSH